MAEMVTEQEQREEAERVALLVEIATCRSYIIDSIPTGADTTNDYWRQRVANLTEKNAK